MAFLHNLLLSIRAGALYASDQIMTVDIRPTLQYSALLMLLNSAAVALRKEPNIVRVYLPKAKTGVVIYKKRRMELSSDTTNLWQSPRAYIIGDLHGNYTALIILFLKMGVIVTDKRGILSFNTDTIQANTYIFLGDYVDRMTHSIEIVALLCYLKLKFPVNIVLLRGNHETLATSMGNTTHKELSTKYGREKSGHIYRALINLFSTLPLACLINETALCIHGGIHAVKLPYLKEIELLRRFCEPNAQPRKESPYYEPMQNLLWADYVDEEPSDADDDGICFNRGRATGILYGPTALKVFLNTNKLTMVIRGHECVPEGFHSNSNQTHYTVFSSPLYDDANRGAYLVAINPADGDLDMSLKLSNTPNGPIFCFPMQYDSIFQHDTMKIQPFICARSAGLIPLPQPISRIADTCQDSSISFEPSCKSYCTAFDDKNDRNRLVYDAVLCLDACLLDLPMDHDPTSADPAPTYKIYGCDGSKMCTIPRIRRFVRLLSELCNCFGLCNYTLLSAFDDFHNWLVAPNGYKYNFEKIYMPIGNGTSHFFFKLGDKNVCVPRSLSQPIFPLSTLELLIEKSNTEFFSFLAGMLNISANLVTVVNHNAHSVDLHGIANHLLNKHTSNTSLHSPGNKG